MDLLPTDEQAAIAEAAADLLTKRGFPGALRGLDASGVDEALWRQCAALGWLGLAAPEDAGGLGLGPPAEVMLFREIGRHLAPGPLLPTVVATHAAVALADTALVSALVAGDRRAAIAIAGADGMLVLHAPGATVALIVDRSGRLRLSDVDALGVLEPCPGLDRATPVARSGVVTEVGDVVPAGVGDRLHLLAAAALAGLAEATRDQAAAYAVARRQFDQPIGAFQAVKHRCADMATRAEAAWAQTCFAAAALDRGRADASQQVAAAAAVAIGAGRANAAANVQVHGGIGFTGEHDAHLFVTRAHVWEVAVGGHRRALDRVLEQGDGRG
jgi:alkylation response protein AidB-like acyl-CoA dehydrogenase